MKYKYLVSGAIIWFMSVCCAWAQVNPYRYGSPHYWMAQCSFDVLAGKFDVAYEHLRKAQKGYRDVGDIAFQIQAVEAMGTLNVALGEWEKANNHYKDALQMAVEYKDDFVQAKIVVNLISLYRTTGNIVGYNHYQKELDSLYNVTNSAKLKTVYHLYWAKEYFARNELAMAETQLQKCWNSMQDLSFSDHEQAKLDYYSNMMNLKQQQKEYKDAIRFAKSHIEQTKKLMVEAVISSTFLTVIYVNSMP